MSFIDKYCAVFNNSVGQHSVIISRAEFANLLGVFSKQEQQLAQLKAENEELKNFHINLVGVKECEIRELAKYKQAVEKIKEIAEKNLNIHTCAFKGCGYDLITKQILQKISEVEE